MKNWKGTKGTVKQEHREVDEYGMFDTEVFSGDTIICTMHWAGERIGSTSHSRREDNANLIVDAFNTVNKCDLLPSKLLEQRGELLCLLIEMHENSNATTHIERERFYRVEKAINKAIK